MFTIYHIITFGTSVYINILRYISLIFFSCPFILLRSIVRAINVKDIRISIIFILTLVVSVIIRIAIIAVITTSCIEQRRCICWMHDNSRSYFRTWSKQCYILMWMIVVVSSTCNRNRLHCIYLIRLCLWCLLYMRDL